MSTRTRHSRLLAFAPVLVLLCGGAAGLEFALSEDEVRNVATVDADAIAETVRVLSGYPSRAPGYPGAAEAARYVREAFAEAGLSDVQEFPFLATTPIEGNARLVGQGLDVPLHAFWPNLVRTCTTPPDGVTGRLVYGGSGALEDLDGLDLEGAIVVLEYNSARNWLNVPMLGGRVVVFIEPETTTHFESAAKFLRTPVDVPRFYIGRAEWERVRSHLGEVFTVSARVDWEDAPAANIIGWVRGRGPSADETVVLSAYYDSMSVVPALAPGAEQACGIAALLELARRFAENPPPRSLLCVATAAHGLFMQGAAELFDNQLDALGVTPSLFIALDLASQSTKVGAFNVGHAYWDEARAARLQCLFEPLGTQLSQLAQRTALATGLYTEAEYRASGMEKDPTLSPFVESLTVTSLSKAGTSWAYTVPPGMVHEAETACLFGTLGFAFVTWDVERRLVDSPLDTFDHVNRENLAQQVGFIRAMLEEILRSTDRTHGFITRIEQIHDWNRQGHRAQFFPPTGRNAGIVSGRVVEFLPKKNYIPDEPKTDALVVVRREDGNTYLGVRCEPIQRVRTLERNGRAHEASFRFCNIGRGTQGYFTARPREIDAFVLDAETGAVVYAKDLGRNGEMTYPTKVYGQTTPQEVRRTVVVFPCYSVDVFDIFDPRYMQILGSLRILDAQTDTEPECYGSAMASGGSGSYYDPCASLFLLRKEGRPHSFKLLGSAGIFGQRLTLLNSDEDVTTGRGFDANTGRIYNTALQAARDMSLINAERIGELEATGVLAVNEASEGGGSLLVDLHARAEAQIARAEAASASDAHVEAMHAARSAWALASRAYPLVLKTQNDAVLSVLFYLALLIPAAYFLEKLLFGFVTIKRQIIARAVIFFFVFFLLRFANPAFRLTVNPYIVLLGFVMIALTLAVLRIIWTMFQAELRRLRAQVTGIHNVEIGRSDAAGMAFGLGISSMRKRKIRTANTLVTLVFLTFSVLSFTSIMSQNNLKGRELYDQSLQRIEAPYNGILFRSPVYAPIIQDAYTYILSEFAEAHTIAPRAWYPGGSAPRNTATRVEAASGKRASVPAVLGLSAQEADIVLKNPDWLTGAWFSEEDRYAVILTKSLAALLDLSEADIGSEAIRVWGRDFTLRGILDDTFFSPEEGFRDIDGEPLSPVNYAMSAQTYQEAVTTRPDIVAKKPPPSFSHFGALNTLVVPYDTAIEMGGTLRSLAIVADDPLTISEKTLRDEVLSKLATGLFAGMDGLSYWYTSLGQADYRGLSSLVILILIASLIVFNTILGSLYERQREIGIYTSLGLAPSHIGAFFLAESCVYAVLGCLAGYLLGQVVGIAKTELGLSLLESLTLNYSSKAALYATLLVAGVVMLSSLYPAWKASRLSVPDLERAVQLPEPVEDCMTLEFPFLFAGDAQVGITAFLFRYFKDQEELATGTFHAEGTTMGLDDGGAHLEAMVWLAPFDWGISQRVSFHIESSGEEGVLFVALRRLDGEVRAWRRVNRRFVADMRRQFLLWRTISPRDRHRYIEYGRRVLDGDSGAELAPVPTPAEA
ncbi:MAG TPA: M28 family peptidase [Candidatus Hydrogenedentes bacterium]|nr:M28 family peptidase [Candidatus Hydrogenedentota bacterium]HPG66679.1 M28 family peptidase [Candidatus Hydrogenedentota bacterium]